jgi:hypothetical protein
LVVCASPSISMPRSAKNARRLGGDLERLRRRALRRELEDPRPVGVEPQLDDHLAREALRHALDLEDEDRPEEREVLEPDAVGRVLGEEGPLAPSRRACAAGRRPERRRWTDVRGMPFSEAEQTWPPGTASTSTTHSGDSRSSGGSSETTTGRSLITESSPFCATRRARTTTPAFSSVRSGVS